VLEHRTTAASGTLDLAATSLSETRPARIGAARTARALVRLASSARGVESARSSQVR